MKAIFVGTALFIGAAFPGGTAAAETGALRVALVKGNLAQASIDPDTNRYEGVSADVAAEFGRRLNRPVEIISLSPQEILSAVEAGNIDIGFVAPNAQRTGQTLFSKPYMLVGQTVMVKTNNGISSVTELDKAGNVIGVNKGDSIALFLSQTLKHAQIRESADMSMEEAINWLRSGSVIAFAGNRQRLGKLIENQGDLALVRDNLHQVPQAVAVPRDDPQLLATLESYLQEMKASGFLQTAVHNSGVAGIAVAP